ncbi:MAG: hypothetical protein Q7V57_17400 [Actinomycetota bacterium]|nr:hypothetical protein [Actinomycetota bacterium]
MATRKVTITIDEADLARVRVLVAEGRARSVSAFVQHAVRISLEDADLWAIELAQALAETGGPLTEAERAWAESWVDGRNGREWA